MRKVWETVQLVKSLSHKHRELRLDLQHLCENHWGGKRQTCSEGSLAGQPGHIVKSQVESERHWYLWLEQGSK